jgi:hypothetical protein
MLSFEDGTPIALIKGGKHDKKILYIRDEDPAKSIKNNPLDMIEDIYKTANKNKLTKNDMSKIKNALEKDDDNDFLGSVYDVVSDVKDKCRDMSKKELKLFDNGVIQPLPRFDKTERCYIAGQTECGKSYYCKKYLEQLRKVYATKKIFVFSDVESDPEIDSLKNIVRFKLDDELLNKDPIRPEKFKDSICVFDDIDSIQNPALLKYIQALRDSLLRRGRHEDISCLITSHLLTNYKDTRIILNECNNITLFPRSGSSHGIKYLLSKHIGMDKKQSQKVVDLPSRWITIHKNHPQYVLYEKGAYVI